MWGEHRKIGAFADVMSYEPVPSLAPCSEKAARSWAKLSVCPSMMVDVVGTSGKVVGVVVDNAGDVVGVVVEVVGEAGEVVGVVVEVAGQILEVVAGLIDL